ncbi:MAG TPA: VacJ family lipoprotein [Geobacteraceae bacterium]
MTISIRRAYPVMIFLYLALNLAGCATTTANLPPEQPAMHSVQEFADDEQILVNDPMEGYNRSIYKFNYNFDKYFFLPVVNTYEFILPTFAQTGVSNFFNNINEFRTLYNSLFQAKGEKALTTLGRFLTNSTIGIGGLFDPATSFGMKRQNEDFGQTLGVWGVDAGPYFVLPLLGPGTVRSAGGFVVDSGIHYAAKSIIDLPKRIDHGDEVIAGLTVLKAIDNRHQQSFRYHDTGYPFEYELVQFLFRQSRELQVMK